MSALTEAELDQLFAPANNLERFGLAVSGGPDSLALMLLAWRWVRRRGVPRPIVYSVDHGLRPEAAAEVTMVCAEATRLGLPARALRWDGPKPASGVQAAARTARYRLLAEAVKADGVSLVATAHHLGDQAETVLMRLAHGSGVEGLRGMDRLATVEGCPVFRPLLGVEPGMLREVVRAAGLVPAEDPSNADRHYERVRWRQMLPALAELGLDARRLAVFARRMASAEEVIAAATEAAWERLVRISADGTAAFARADFAELPEAVAVRLLGRVLDRIGGGRKPHALTAVETLRRRLLDGTEMKPTTLHGCLVESDGIGVFVRRERARRRGSLLTAN